MAEPVNVKGILREFHIGCSVHLYSDEAQSHHRNYSFAQRLRRTFGILLREDVDQTSGQVWTIKAAFYPAREYCYSDLCRRHLRHSLFRYACLPTKL